MAPASGGVRSSPGRAAAVPRTSLLEPCEVQDGAGQAARDFAPARQAGHDAFMSNGHPALAGLGRGRALIIGEVALTHDGSLGRAHAYVDAIANAGADAVKFQTHIAAAES